MSWIYAVVGTERVIPVPGGLEETHADPLFVARLPSLYVAAGGIPETCLFETVESGPASGWVVVGLGIELSKHQSKLMDKDDWRRVLSPTSPGAIHSMAILQRSVGRTDGSSCLPTNSVSVNCILDEKIRN